jgi:hypothetical protein
MGLRERTGTWAGLVIACGAPPLFAFVSIHTFRDIGIAGQVVLQAAYCALVPIIFWISGGNASHYSRMPSRTVSGSSSHCRRPLVHRVASTATNQRRAKMDSICWKWLTSCPA